MDPGDALALVGIISIAGMALGGLKMFFGYRLAKLKVEGGGGQNVDRLTDAVEQLRDVIEAQRVEMAELHERVDFTERMLAKARGEDNRPLAP